MPFSWWFAFPLKRNECDCILMGLQTQCWDSGFQRQCWVKVFWWWYSEDWHICHMGELSVLSSALFIMTRKRESWWDIFLLFWHGRGALVLVSCQSSGCFCLLKLEGENAFLFLYGREVSYITRNLVVLRMSCMVSRRSHLPATLATDLDSSF